MLNPCLVYGNRRPTQTAGLPVLFLILIALAPTALGQPGSPRANIYKETILYRFTGLVDDGAFPEAGLVEDSQGNLYGTTFAGGAYGNGIVYKLNRSGRETVLYTFTIMPDATSPLGLVLDTSGNLYGASYDGGTHSCGNATGTSGCGTVFRINNKGNETVLYSFQYSPDGANPDAGLTPDGSGNFYGTTRYGGVNTNCGEYGCGTVFKIDSSGHESVLHSFTVNGGDGAYPSAALIVGTQGDLYGTTYNGGTGLPSCGMVFKMSSSGRETVLYDFPASKEKGCGPFGLVQDAKSNLYGVTETGGRYGLGTVFEVSENGKEKVLYSFRGLRDGSFPQGTLLRDAQGNLYGNTYGGGDLNCQLKYAGCGVVFKVTPTGKETVLHVFKGGRDGAGPYGSSLIWDAAGNIFGTTNNGGTICDAGQGCGVVFELSPQ